MIISYSAEEKIASFREDHMKKCLIALFTLLIFCGAADAKIKIKHKTKPQVQDYHVDYLNLNWWKNYNDPILVNHLQTVYNNNNDLKIVNLKVKEGEKLVKISFSSELPQVSFAPRFIRTMESSDLFYGDVEIPNYAQSNYVLPLTMSYEVDIWGKRRDQTKSVEKKVQTLKQDEKAGYISITSSFAISYFNLVKLDKLIELQENLISTQKQIVNLVKIKNQNGLCPVNIVLSEEKTLHDLNQTLNKLDDRKDVLIDEMGVYLSEANIKDFQRINYDKLPLIKNLPNSINSEIIEERPDVIRAEDYLQAVGYDVRVSKKDLLPRVLIAGELGFNAYQWSDLLTSNARMGSYGIFPTWDVFSGGRKMAMLKLKKLEYDEAMERYKKTVLASIQEINTNLASEKVMKKNYQEAVNKTKLENQNFNLISQKQKSGLGSVLEILYFKEKLILTEQNEVSDKMNYIISSINLYKAVGGKDLYALKPQDL